MLHVALAVALLSAVGPGPRPQPARKETAVQLLRSARRECGHPGPKLASLLERSFNPAAFGKAVLEGWKHLSPGQQRDFATLADAVVGAQQREMYVSELCQVGQRVVWTGKVDDKTTRIKTTAPIKGLEEYAELWFRDDGDRWTFLGAWCCGVDAFTLEWRQALHGTYDAAMEELNKRARSMRSD